MSQKLTTPPPAAPALFLFDIDGTLIRRAGPHHRAALENALFRVTGLRATTDGIPVQGMLDRDILREMLRAAGASRQIANTHMTQIGREAQNLYRGTCPDLHAKVCPGVRRLLRGLLRRGIPAGLVTGNLSRIGWRKMERAGLRGYFCLGAFSEQGHTRAELAGRAAAEARRRGLVRADAPVVLVGDHPNDIAAARANGFLSVAVATGVVPLEELRPHAPDILVEDLRGLDLEKLLCAWPSPASR
ncbi:MAG: haloacid dehalogenase-like hydrolase [Bryobacteraceae bacterium]|nr:haloacid dehalogenase-like hydrolase [Bryobacteraceae bacterium]